MHLISQGLPDALVALNMDEGAGLVRARSRREFFSELPQKSFSIYQSHATTSNPDLHFEPEAIS